MTVGVFQAVLITRLEAWVVPGESLTCPGLTVSVGALAMLGETVARSVTFPMNRFRLFTSIVENPDEPAVMVNEDGLTAMEKSASGGGVIATNILTECLILPLVPVRFRL